MKLAKFTVLDPNARLSLSIKESVYQDIGLYVAFYNKVTGHPVTQGEIVEQILKTFFSEDKDFQKQRAALAKAATSAPDVSQPE